MWEPRLGSGKRIDHTSKYATWHQKTWRKNAEGLQHRARFDAIPVQSSMGVHQPLRRAVQEAVLKKISRRSAELRLFSDTLGIQKEDISSAHKEISNVNIKVL
jgi:hypothetical protein